MGDKAPIVIVGTVFIVARTAVRLADKQPAVVLRASI
jgi:hypothetical protein